MSDQPNILLILADEHRWDCLGDHGNRDVRTPHLDSLARDGIRHDNAFCCYPSCTPSRYSLLTGQYVHDHRGWNNVSTPLPDAPTFPRILREVGYRTKAVGKMHFTPTYLDLGFDELELAEQDGEGRWDDDYHRGLRRLGLVDRNDLEDQREEFRVHAPRRYWETFGAMASNLPEEHHSTTWIGDRAMAAINDWRGGGGNLLAVGFIKPHHPFDPPQRWADMYDPDTLSPPPGWIDRCLPRDLEFNRGYFPHDSLTGPALRRMTAFYYATISQMDFQIGRMIESLKARGLYDNTMVVYTADHGDYVGFHHLVLKSGLMYDPTVRVPLIIKYPSTLPAAGASHDELVSLVDVAPTILSVAGLPADGRMGGCGLLNPAAREFVFAESRSSDTDPLRGHHHVMVRSRTGKLLLNRRAPGRSLFFDLAGDPVEITDAFNRPAHRATIAAMERAAAGWLTPNGDSPKHVDESSPRIRQPNIPPADDSHRPEIIRYFTEAMAGERAKLDAGPAAL